MNDYILVRYHNEPNDTYRAVICSGTKEMCEAKQYRYSHIFTDGRDTFVVEPNK